MRFSSKPLLTALLALCLLALSTAARAQTTAEESLSVNSILDLAADGGVENVTLAGSDLLPHVATAVESAIRRMQFTPVVVDGQPRRVRTSALFKIGFTGSDADRKLAVSVIVMGLPVAMSSPYPRFPEGALARGHGAEVWLLVEVDGSGKVIASEPAAVVLSGLSRASGDDRERAASVSEFIEMSKSAVALWNIRMVEADANGRMRLLVPFNFGLQEEGDASRRFPPTLFPGLRETGADFEQLRARSAALPSGTLLQVSLLR